MFLGLWAEHPRALHILVPIYIVALLSVQQVLHLLILRGVIHRVIVFVAANVDGSRLAITCAISANLLLF